MPNSLGEDQSEAKHRDRTSPPLGCAPQGTANRCPLAAPHPGDDRVRDANLRSIVALEHVNWCIAALGLRGAEIHPQNKYAPPGLASPLRSGADSQGSSALARQGVNLLSDYADGEFHDFVPFGVFSPHLRELLEGRFQQERYLVWRCQSASRAFAALPHRLGLLEISCTEHVCRGHLSHNCHRTRPSARWTLDAFTESNKRLTGTRRAAVAPWDGGVETGKIQRSRTDFGWSPGFDRAGGLGWGRTPSMGYGGIGLPRGGPILRESGKGERDTQIPGGKVDGVLNRSRIKRLVL